MRTSTTRNLAIAAGLTLAFGALTAGIAGATNTVQIDSTIKLRKSFRRFTARSRPPTRPARTTGW